LEDFAATASDAYDLSESGGLAVIGIRPDRPETGFGYIEVGEPRGPGAAVKQFREKPDLKTAERWVADGGFLWNSGMFFWTLGAFADELEHADADVHEAFLKIKDALAAGDASGAEAAFALLPDTSIDYLLMENARQVSVVESRFEWDDLGSWDALERSLPADENGNAVAGTANILESSGCIVAGFSGQRISILGCDDLVVAAVDGEILVMPKSRAQEVKRLIPRKPDGQS
jgi:mannose-1-phosphate guanylyltransferase